MRFSSILIPLALLFINSISAQELMIGTWTVPSISKNASQYCCVPTSVVVNCTGYVNYCTADYFYPWSSNSTCYNLFMTSSSGKLKLYVGGAPRLYKSETTFFGNMNFNFLASNESGSPILNIYSTSSFASGQCDFTMTALNAPPDNSTTNSTTDSATNPTTNTTDSTNSTSPTPSNPTTPTNNSTPSTPSTNSTTTPSTTTSPTTTSTGGNNVGLIVGIVIIFVIVTCCGANQYQKNRVNVLITQNIAQQPVIVTTYNASPVYVAPSHQGFVQQQQPQMAYIAPGQFPNTQVNMNYGGYN